MSRNAKIAAKKDKLNQRLVKKWYKYFYSDLNRAIKPVIEIMKQSPTAQTIDYALEALSMDGLSKTLEKAYRQAIVSEAKLTIDTIAPGKGFLPTLNHKEEINPDRVNLTPQQAAILGMMGGYGEFTAEQILWVRDVTKFINEQGLKTIVSLNTTNKKIARNAINKVIIEAMRDGLGTFETAKMIEKSVLQEWRIQSKFRADRIARTELGKASSYSTIRTADATGLQYAKQWFTFLDGRERESHAAANGAIVPKQGVFTIGSDKMTAPRLGSQAGENVNCRCQVLPVLIGRS